MTFDREINVYIMYVIGHYNITRLWKHEGKNRLYEYNEIEKCLSLFMAGVKIA